MKVMSQELVSDAIDMSDVVGFFKRNRLLIIAWAIIGLLVSVPYIIQKQSIYEARFLLQMAQFVNRIDSGSAGGISYGNSEDPAELIQRLRLPSIYPGKVLQSCGMSENSEFGNYMGGKLVVQPVRNVANAVEVKVLATSPELARKCSEAIVDMIMEQQRELTQHRLSGRKEQLAQYQKTLSEEQELLETIKKTDLGNFGYLAKLDKLSWLRARIDALQEEAQLSQMHPARLIAPIVVPSTSVSTRKELFLLFGLLMGLVLGGVHALIQSVWRKTLGGAGGAA